MFYEKVPFQWLTFIGIEGVGGGGGGSEVKSIKRISTDAFLATHVNARKF